jgi:Zn-dependent protease with chaperone function
MTSVKAIEKSFGYRLQGNKRMKHIVCHTVSKLPANFITQVTSHCWFVSSFDDSWAFALRAEDFKKNDALIFLSDELLAEDEAQIQFTIAHEIGHVVLGHRNAILTRQSKSEIQRQEKEADDFAAHYVNNP